MGGAPNDSETTTGPAIAIRPYREDDRSAVIALFTRINRELSTPETNTAFEAYIVRSIDEEIGQIARFYDTAIGNSFWIAERANQLVGMYGLERLRDGVVELRRMYVDPDIRRQGLARRMLAHAETVAVEAGYRRMELSTSELQEAALGLYRRSGFRGETEYVAEDASHKTIGGGIRRYVFHKDLSG